MFAFALPVSTLSSSSSPTAATKPTAAARQSLDTTRQSDRRRTAVAAARAWGFHHRHYRLAAATAAASAAARTPAASASPSDAAAVALAVSPPVAAWTVAIDKPPPNPAAPGSSRPDSDTAVLERPPETQEPAAKRKVDPGKKYRVLLFNDDVNTRDHVTRSLLKCVPELSQADATAIMQKAHSSGMATVGIWIFELSEAYCDLLRGEGLRSDIEPAE